MSIDEEWEASFLEQARDGLALSGDAQERHLARLESNLARGITASVMGDPAFSTAALTKQVTRAATLSAPVKSWLWRVHPLSLLGGGLILGGLAGVFAGYELSPGSDLASISAPKSNDQEPNDVAGEAQVVPPTTEGVQLEDLQDQGDETDVALAPARKSKAPPAADEPPEPTFYEELSYLRRAQAALRGGKPSLALGIMTSLDEMQKVGALDLERRVTKALALCDLGRAGEAKAVSAPIFEKQSHSVYAKRLKESCVGEGASTEKAAQ
jgi:hypothetical protein